MPLFCRFAAVMLAVLCAAACADDPSGEFGDADRIDLSSGGMRPRSTDVQSSDDSTPTAQTPAMEGSIRGLEFSSLTDDHQDTFASHLDKPLVVNFFAAWCSPCRAELPEFETVYQELEDQVNFIGISRDDSVAPSLDLLAETGVSYPSGWDRDGSLVTELRLLGMPSTLMVDRDGVVVEQWTGVLTAEGLRRLITEHLL